MIHKFVVAVLAAIAFAGSTPAVAPAASGFCASHTTKFIYKSHLRFTTSSTTCIDYTSSQIVRTFRYASWDIADAGQPNWGPALNTPDITPTKGFGWRGTMVRMVFRNRATGMICQADAYSRASRIGPSAAGGSGTVFC